MIHHFYGHRAMRREVLLSRAPRLSCAGTEGAEGNRGRLHPSMPFLVTLGPTTSPGKHAAGRTLVAGCLHGFALRSTCARWSGCRALVALRDSVAPARLGGGVRERTLPLTVSYSRLGASRKTKSRWVHGEAWRSRSFFRR